MPNQSELEKMAQKLRRHSVEMTTASASGHPTTCLSAAEIISTLFFHEMRWDPKAPHARDVDTFVLSKGHAAPILWAALKEAGGIEEDLLTLRKFDSTLEGHPTPRNPWVRVATGSLGQGLSCAAGMAIARRHDGIPARIYCLMGDGESAEGSVWEAAQFASYNQLDNLCALVDVNALGQSGGTMPLHNVDSYLAKFISFGWHAISVDGHNIEELIGAFEKAKNSPGKPTAIICKTEKGKGFPEVEGKSGWHGKPFKKDGTFEKAIEAFGDTEISLDVPSKRVEAESRPESSFALEDPALTPTYSKDDQVATREGYGSALVKLGKVCSEIMALDGDTKNSTFSEKFKNAHPDRFVECFIAEQNMAGVALGLAVEGKVPFASSFACFLSRAYDQIRMSVYSRPTHLIFNGSHVGVSIGGDGASQMGLEDIAMFRALLGTTVLYPGDGVSAERLTCAAALTPGIVYVRSSRPKTRILYNNEEMFPIGGSKTWGEGTDATIVAAGVTLHEALEAQKVLKNEDIHVRVIDAYSVKPIDEETLKKASEETRAVITVEDHSAHGGLGEAVASVIGPVKMLAVRDIPRSGEPDELLDKYGINCRAIVAAVKERIGK